MTGILVGLLVIAVGTLFVVLGTRGHGVQGHFPRGVLGRRTPDWVTGVFRINTVGGGAIAVLVGVFVVGFSAWTLVR